MTQLFYLPRERVLDNNAKPGDGWLLNFYKPDTSTRKDTYVDGALTTAHTNPVEADCAGEFPPIYMVGNYKVVLTDEKGVQKWTVDPYFAGSGAEVSADNIKALTDITADNLGGGEIVFVRAFYSNTDTGGGHFYWDADRDKADANGGTIIDPDNVGTLSDTALGTFLSQQGTGSGTGCWVRLDAVFLGPQEPHNMADPYMFGARADGAFDDTQSINSASTAIGLGGILRLLLGTYRATDTLVFDRIHVSGRGFYRTHRGPFGSSNYPDDSRFQGTVIRSEVESGNGLETNTTTSAELTNLSDFIMIGPGTGTSTGVYAKNLLSSHWENVCIANFSMGVDYDFFEDCTFNSLRVSGCLTGLRSIIDGNNQNVFVNPELQNCETSILMEESTLNVFYGGILQGAAGIDGIVLGPGARNNVFHDVWYEFPGGLPGDLIRTQGDNCGQNKFLGGNINAGNSSITLNGGTGGTGNHQLVDLVTSGGNTITVDVNVNGCSFRYLSSGEFVIDDADAARTEIIDDEALSPWQVRADYDRGQTRNTPGRAGFLSRGLTSINLWLWSFYDEADSLLGGWILRNQSNLELRDSSGNTAHNFDLDAGVNEPRVGTRFPPQDAEPSNPGTGLVVLADGSSWDPLSVGSGNPYFVWWNGSAWVRMDA